MDDLLCQAKAFFFHVLRKKNIKASEFAGLVLGRYADSSDGPACNFLYILGMRGGVMTSLALLHCIFQGGYRDGEEATHAYPGCFPSKCAGVRLEGNGLKSGTLKGCPVTALLWRR